MSENNGGRAAFVAAILIAFATPAFADTGNADFAASVQKHLAAMKSDKKQVDEAKQVCKDLPQSRFDNDPVCVAMQKFYSEEVRKGSFQPGAQKSW